MNQDAVDYHAVQLEAHLGKRSFEAVFQALLADRRVRGPEAAAIASSFVARTAKSAPKGQSLQRIHSRHNNIVSARMQDEILSHGNR